ncbi:hypothetical protein [Clostridium tagluense]|uniref:hypothetical protein n=1 Tax=Clostridium tagluense TaxID=360422 RepID=UPI001C6F1B55|nr:hypothetical protein [Clostridium tagluense]MBW9158484.1 hypothetical protein [Clostridium tagluense]WLC67344.1 hypothetical protein KTC93_09270 [Clostridium tagluense]
MNLKETNSILYLEKLKNLMLSGSLLSKDTFIVDDLDSIMDSREESNFDKQWIRNYNKINEKRYLINFKIKELIDSIREIAYKITYAFTESSDLAAYVSDDFGLIAEALVLNHNDEWLNTLGKKYLENKIPNGTLNPSKGELRKILLMDNIL